MCPRKNVAVGFESINERGSHCGSECVCVCLGGGGHYAQTCHSFIQISSENHYHYFYRKFNEMQILEINIKAAVYGTQIQIC